MSKRWAALGMILALVIVNGASANHHALGASSVDQSGGVKEIRWEDYTKYDDERVHSINQWNALGKVNIQPDAWNTITDLYFEDFNNCNDYDAKWVNGTTVDSIKFNTCKMDTYNANQKKAIAVHEMGHASGIADHPRDRSCCQFKNEAIMYWDSKATGFTTPQTHDKNDYKLLWP